MTGFEPATFGLWIQYSRPTELHRQRRTTRLELATIGSTIRYSNLIELCSPTGMAGLEPTLPVPKTSALPLGYIPTPENFWEMSVSGLEPKTISLKGYCSNQLSYTPMDFFLGTEIFKYKNYNFVKILFA